MKIYELSDHSCQLGESPLWDSEEGALYWVDSLGPALYRHDHASSKVRCWQLPGASVGSLALRRHGGLILAMCHGPGNIRLRSA